VAEAAEGDVDAYVVKPFTMETLRLHIAQAGIDKIKPEGYRGTIARGRDLLLEGKLTEAMTLFREAKSLSGKPSLACYYEGQGFERLKEPDHGQKSYEEGLLFNELHYRCSVALFDLLVSKKSLDRAYSVISKVSGVFPMSPKRLCATIDLAVRTQHFDDVDRYYEIFSKLDERREDLKRYLSAALVVGAMYQLRHKNSARAVSLLGKAALTAGDQPGVLREIVLTLAEHGELAQAKKFLERFPPVSRQAPVYLSAEYAILDKTAPGPEVLSKGRKLIQGGIQDPLIYRILIRRTVEAQPGDAVVGLVNEASVIWPSQAATFKALAK
jgi:hypothetical protein